MLQTFQKSGSSIFINFRLPEIHLGKFRQTKKQNSLKLFFVGFEVPGERQQKKSGNINRKKHFWQFFAERAKNQPRVPRPIRGQRMEITESTWRKNEAHPHVHSLANETTVVHFVGRVRGRVELPCIEAPFQGESQVISFWMSKAGSHLLDGQGRKRSREEVPSQITFALASLPTCPVFPVEIGRTVEHERNLKTVDLKTWAETAAVVKKCGGADIVQSGAAPLQSVDDCSLFDNLVCVEGEEEEEQSFWSTVFRFPPRSVFFMVGKYSCLNGFTLFSTLEKAAKKQTNLLLSFYF